MAGPSGGRHLGHLGLVDEARPLVDVERALQVEDRPAVLDGDDAPGRERAAVADTVDLVEDRRRSGRPGAGSTSAGSGRGRDSHGPPGGHERLSGHLSAEDALAGLVEVLAAEDVHFDRLEVEQFDELV